MYLPLNLQVKQLVSCHSLVKTCRKTNQLPHEEQPNFRTEMETMDHLHNHNARYAANNDLSNYKYLDFNLFY